MTAWARVARQGWALAKGKCNRNGLNRQSFLRDQAPHLHQLCPRSFGQSKEKIYTKEGTLTKDGSPGRQSWTNSFHPLALCVDLKTAGTVNTRQRSHQE